MIEELFLILTHSVQVVVFLAIPTYLFIKDRRRLVLYLTALFCVLLVTYGLKYATGIERPEDSAWEKVTPRFPSGHTSLAFTPLLFFKLWKQRAPLLLYASVVAYTRIHFNLHVPVDILASVVIAISVSAMVLRYKDLVLENLRWLPFDF